jgi:hypothetical protein
MDRNDELRNDEISRADELRREEMRRSDEADQGYTTSDSLVRDDSVVAGRGDDIVADRTVRANDGIVDDRVVHHDREPSAGDQVGEAAGGIGGVLAGAAIGSLGGPIGTVVGGIAGAIGGWWTGRAIAEAASNFSHADDQHFRTDYHARASGTPSNPDLSYDRVRPAYQLGYLASRNPDYAGQSFEDIEPHLERGWRSGTQGADWNDMRDYARTAYVRGAASQSSLTGDPSAKNSFSSTGTHGSIGTGADVPESEPAGTTDEYGALTPTDFDEEGIVVDRSASSDASNRTSSDASRRSSIADDVESRLASPAGSSFTRQGDVPLNSSVTDRAGVVRAQDNDKQATRESGALRGNEANRGASYTDPVAGEGVENIGSSGLSPRGEGGALNETPRDDEMRNTGEDRAERY